MYRNTVPVYKITLKAFCLIQRSPSFPVLLSMYRSRKFPQRNYPKITRVVILHSTLSLPVANSLCKCDRQTETSDLLPSSFLPFSRLSCCHISIDAPNVTVRTMACPMKYGQLFQKKTCLFCSGITAFKLVAVSLHLERDASKSFH